MSKTLRLGVLLPTRGLLLDDGGGSDGVAQLLTMARAVEAAGLDSVWVGDSLTAKPRLEPLTTLAAVAVHTRRVRLGTAVMLAALRHPVLLAHAAGTVDLISGGRLVLGVGVGGAFNEAQQQEWRSVGVEPSQRAGRMEEVVGLLKRLTAGETVTHKGRHFALDAVQVQPASRHPGGVPVLVACHWRAGQDRQFKRSATLGDGYISISDSPEEYAKVAARVRHHAEAAGRDFDALEAAFYMTVNLQEDDRRAAGEADRFLRLYYGTNIWGDRWGPFGPPERTAERIHQYADAGAGTVIVRFASFEQERQLDTFLSEVVPRL